MFPTEKLLFKFSIIATCQMKIRILRGRKLKFQLCIIYSIYFFAENNITFLIVCIQIVKIVFIYFTKLNLIIYLFLTIP